MWTKEDQARVRTLHTKQMTVKEIAEEMGKPQGVVRAALEDMGYKPIESKPVPDASEFTGKRVEIPKKPYRKTTTADVTKILELKAQGISNRGIAARLGMSKSSVTYALTKFKEDKPMSNEIKEKEPASVGADASSKGVIDVKNETSSQPYDTTDKPESQAPALTGIKMMMEVEAMLGEVFGGDAKIIDINANGDHCDIGFTYHGREYSMLFAEREEVPSYGNDKH